jgi:hypothetical protein
MRAGLDLEPSYHAPVYIPWRII